MSHHLHGRAKIALGIFLAGLIVSIWPAYAAFSRIEPRILGVPFSLSFIVLVIATVFVTLLWLYLWEVRNDKLD